MNWTGGGLSRSRNARGSLSAKQKNYFARARGKLQSGKSPRSEVQSFDLGDWKPTVKIRRSPHTNDGSMRTSPGQSTLDAFENIQPIVKRLESLQPRDLSDKRKRAPLQPLDSQTTQRNEEAPNPIVIGSSQSRSSTLSSQSPVSKPQPQQTSWAKDSSTVSIEDRRRRLLQMHDWVGLHRPATKPVKMQFADPADRDMIGKRRKISKTEHSHPPAKRRMVTRPAPILTNDITAIPPVHDQYYNVDDISVRIGSAVDRITREGTTGSLGVRREQTSVFSDELLDDGNLASVHNGSPPRPARKSSWSASTSLRLSDFANRNVLTPSAFMDDSLGAPSSRSGGHIKAPVRSSSLARSLESIDLISPKKASPNGPDFRLVFESSPDCHASKRDVEKIKSPFRNWIDQEEGHNEPLRVFAPSKDYGFQQANCLLTHDNRTVNNFAIADSSQATRPLRKENYLSRISRRERLQYNIEEDVDHSENQLVERNMNSNTGDQGRDYAPRIGHQSLLQTKSPRKETSRSREVPTLRTQDHAASSRNPSPPREKPVPNPDQQTVASHLAAHPQDIDTSKITEDEEAIWRKFVFGDEGFNDDASDHLDAGSQEPSSHSHHFACTQPSLIAEIDTSPLKQNPHLADATFDESLSKISEASFTKSSDSDVGCTPYALERKLHRSRDLYSIPSSEKDGITASTHPAQQNLPQKWPHNPNRSSLLGEATSSPQPSSLLPEPSISSDELHRSPGRLPFETTISKRSDQTIASSPPCAPQTQAQPPLYRMEKVLYKKPPRYVGERPAEPTRLGGRVLRSGKRVYTQKAGQRGRKRENEHEMLDADADDDDEIVDD